MEAEPRAPGQPQASLPVRPWSLVSWAGRAGGPADPELGCDGWWGTGSQPLWALGSSLSQSLTPDSGVTFYPHPPSVKCADVWWVERAPRGPSRAAGLQYLSVQITAPSFLLPLHEPLLTPGSVSPSASPPKAGGLAPAPPCALHRLWGNVEPYLEVYIVPSDAREAPSAPGWPDSFCCLL